MNNAYPHRNLTTIANLTTQQDMEKNAPTLILPRRKSLNSENRKVPYA